jgi:hypothetical protein
VPLNDAHFHRFIPLMGFARRPAQRLAGFHNHRADGVTQSPVIICAAQRLPYGAAAFGLGLNSQVFTASTLLTQCHGITLVADHGVAYIHLACLALV